MTESLARADMIDPADAKDITDPAEPADATENADPAEPIEPIEANEPTEPIEKAEPFEAIERNESSDQSESELCEGAPSEARSNPFNAGGLTARGRPRLSARTVRVAPPPNPPPAQ
jgi:hypothetical protein